MFLEFQPLKQSTTGKQWWQHPTAGGAMEGTENGHVCKAPLIHKSAHRDPQDAPQPPETNNWLESPSALTSTSPHTPWHGVQEGRLNHGM